MAHASWGGPCPRVAMTRITGVGGLPLYVRAGDVAVIMQWLVNNLHSCVKPGAAKRASAGGYVCRHIRGSSTAWSNHAWALAIDLNPGTNPMSRRRITDFDPVKVHALLARLQGVVRWGYDYSGRYDCLSGDTQVITKQGVRRIEELSGGEHEVLTRDLQTHESVWVKAPFRSFGLAPVREVVLKRRNVTHVVRVTDNHRWYLADGGVVTTAELKVGARIPAVEYPVQPVALDPEYIARGIVWGDGNITNKHSNPIAVVRLYGEKLDDLGQYVEPFSASRWADGGYSRIPVDFKSVPNRYCSDEQAAAFFAGWFACDGFVSSDYVKNPPPSLSTSDPEAVAWLQAIAPRIGLTITNVVVQKAGVSGFNSTKDNYQIKFRSLPENLILRDKHRGREIGRGSFYAWKVVEVGTDTSLEETYCPTVKEYNTFCLATASVPMLIGQSMHFEVVASVNDTRRVANLIRAGKLGAGTGTAPVFSVGAKGAKVTEIEVRLLLLGYNPGVVDQMFTAETKQAVISLQKRLGFTGKDVDGIVGPVTLGKLDRFPLGLKAIPQKPGEIDAVLHPGEGLRAGQLLRSASGRFTFSMQTDGNVVVFDQKARKMLWNTGFRGTGVVMQLNGDLMLRVSAGGGSVPLWSSQSSKTGGPGCKLVMQDDGNAVVYSKDGKAVWASNSVVAT